MNTQIVNEYDRYATWNIFLLSKLISLLISLNIHGVVHSYRWSAGKICILLKMQHCSERYWRHFHEICFHGLYFIIKIPDVHRVMPAFSNIKLAGWKQAEPEKCGCVFVFQASSHVRWENCSCRPYQKAGGETDFFMKAREHHSMLSFSVDGRRSQREHVEPFFEFILMYFNVSVLSVWPK